MVAELRGKISMTETGQTDTGFRILMVCTGNICRSAAAQLLLDRRLERFQDRRIKLHISSAGTRAVLGAPVHQPMAELLQAEGLDPSSFSAKQVQEQQIVAADLILTMSSEHRSALVELTPVALRKTYTLGEMGAIVKQFTAEELQHVQSGSLLDRFIKLVATAASYRGGLDLAALDIADPYLQEQHVYESSFEQIRSNAETLVQGAVGDVLL